MFLLIGHHCIRLLFSYPPLAYGVKRRAAALLTAPFRK